MKRRWRRGKVDWLYEYVEGEKVLATVERYDPPGNSHFFLWSVQGATGHWPTKREAQRWVEKQQDSTISATTPEVKGEV